jgi:hypothetical protein
MPDCDWRAYRAVARSGLVAAAIFLAPAGHPAEHGAKRDSQPETTAERYQGRTAEITRLQHVNGTSPGKAAPDQSTTNHDGEGSPKWTDVVLAFAAVGSFIFTVVLTVSTILLWLETRRLASGAESQSGYIEASSKAAIDSASAALTQAQAMVATERSNIAIGETLDPHEDMFLLKVRNIGRTPGTIKSCTTFCFPELPGSADWLLPGMQWHPVGYSMQAGSDAVIAIIKIPEFAKFLVGMFDHVDAFKKVRREYFRFELRGTGWFAYRYADRWVRTEEMGDETY